MELLGTIVIMGIIFAIAISNVANIIQNSKYNAILKNEIFLIKAAQTYLSTYQEDYPIEIGQTNEITLDTLINNNFIPK
ncbi:MAG TPA: hypothetical protein GX690_00270, partial [Tenericutes bacterium]|nr:hypothetical protein [Mycoplasmatota bacterium]